jgi:Xaa-Pro dipeptidase
MLRIPAIQDALCRESLDGWLLTDQHHRDPLAYRVLGLRGTEHASRRWFFWIPVEGDPVKLVHRIEPRVLDTLPGERLLYSRWLERLEKLKQSLGGARRVAMQYSPRCEIPYVATVDAGSVELVQSMGVEVVSSADLIQQFDAVLTTAQIDSHFEAGRRVDRVRRGAFELVRDTLLAGSTISEFQLQTWIRESFDREGLVTEQGPIVAVNANASDPHYEPSPAASSPIHAQDLLLIDLWAKLRTSQSIYYDVTWVGYCGSSIPDLAAETFAVAARARDHAVAGIQDAASAGKPIRGCDVDDLAREVIKEHHLDEYFFHRTGHSIGVDVHGTGANMDNFETHDTRRIIPSTCFSIEPGIYRPEFGIRTEVNVMMMGDGEARVTGEVQRAIVPLMP